MSPNDLRNKSFEYFDETSLVGIPIFYKKKIIEQLKDGTYFQLTPIEFQRISLGFIPLKKVHTKVDNGGVHVKLTNTQRRSLLAQFN